MGTFDWMQFPEARARFSGGVRGFDELGHETFAVEVDGTEYFGEIEADFLANQNDYNIRVLSFGYGSDKDVGMPMLGTCRIFTTDEIAIIQTLITMLIAAGLQFTDRPFLLLETSKSHFMGQVIFQDGWVLVRDEESIS
jgi:hypothetical protein